MWKSSGLSAILLFGNDYQLFPVINDGAIQGYSKYQNIVRAGNLPDEKDIPQQLKRLFGQYQAFKSVKMTNKSTAMIKLRTDSDATAAFKGLKRLN